MTGWNLHAKGTPQAGAAFNTVLDAVTDQMFKTAHRAGRHEPLPAYTFDALMALADHTADRAAAADRANHNTQPAASQPANPARPTSADGDPGPGVERRPGLILPGHSGTGDTERAAPRLIVPGQSGPAGIDHTGDRSRPAQLIVPGHSSGPETETGVHPPRLIVPGPNGGPAETEPAAQPPAERAGRFNPRYRALLRVDVAALRRGQVAGDELCEIAGDGPVPVPVAHGLLGQAILDLVITRGVDVVNVTHLGRGPTTAQKIALAWAQPGCTVAGCWRTRTEHDHRTPWAQTRHTRLDELDPLCEFHHDLKTRHGWALVPGTGNRALAPRRPPTPQPPNRRPK